MEFDWTLDSAVLVPAAGIAVVFTLWMAGIEVAELVDRWKSRRDR